MDPRLQRGWILLDQHRYAQAEAELSRALATDVDKVLGLYWLAWAQLSQGKYAEAEGNIARCLAQNPERAEGYHARAVLLRRKGDLSGAEAAARIALGRDHHTVEYRAELAWILLLRKRAEAALELIEGGLEDEPQSVDLHRVRGQCLADLGRLEAARESALETMALDPQDARSRRLLGWIAFRQEDYDEAQKQYTEALRLDPSSEYARTSLLDALRHRIWYYRLLVPKNAAKTGRRFLMFFYALVAVCAALRAVPAANLVLGAVLISIFPLALVRWYLGATVGPVTTLLLRMNPVARRALPADDIECSTFAGMLMFAAMAFFVAALLGAWHGFFAVGVFFMLLIVPLTKVYKAREGAQRKVAECCAWLLFSTGCFGIAAVAQEWYGAAAASFLFYGAGSVFFEGMAGTIGRIVGQGEPGA